MGVRDLLKKHEGKGGKTGWFKLANDGNSCLVRFLTTDVDDLEVYEVHKVEIDGFKKAVLCKGDDCPMCKAGNNAQLRLWLPLQNLEKDGKPVELWERGKVDIELIVGLIDENGNLNERDYKIVRKGKAGDMKTTYQYFYKDKDIRTDLPEKPVILGRQVLELSEADMVKALDGELSLQNNNSSAGSTSNNNAGKADEEVF